jgi:hypothetical protein
MSEGHSGGSDAAAEGHSSCGGQSLGPDRLAEPGLQPLGCHRRLPSAGFCLRYFPLTCFEGVISAVGVEAEASEGDSSGRDRFTIRGSEYPQWCTWSFVETW